MTGFLPRTLRLDPSDTVIFDRAAEPGEWAVPGAFEFWEEDPAAMAGKRRQAFRGGFLGLSSFGWSTLVEVAAASALEREVAVSALARHIRTRHGAPDDAAARAAALEEIGFAESLCDGHAAGTVLALSRSLEEGEVRERFRTLHLRDTPHTSFNALPVFGMVTVEGEDEPVERPDLMNLGDRA
ncbi:DUF6505 family protein [Falsiroseomonas stagni]|uniref:Uncharacterized protein n=1 Tax=Falsiroseomonas stagni DSM 19981 TaxID=1123062 RepID=A0A1I4DG17_9PROT|nr:DUF6505 family protein [Falsiroseomonas stagni]SFK90811.1 hypothetical protein SAMN02745775_110100 [Falsiroseomonas stagni DSM 19981]